MNRSQRLFRLLFPLWGIKRLQRYEKGVRRKLYQVDEEKDLRFFNIFRCFLEFILDTEEVSNAIKVFLHDDANALGVQ